MTTSAPGDGLEIGVVAPYQELAEEDVRLAEEGMVDYQRLLADVDHDVTVMAAQ